MKKKKFSIFSILPIIILALFIIKPYFHAGFPYTHDGENHLARFANYKTALREGQFPPRFAPNLVNHYGYPVFNYNYPLANILSTPFSFLKLNYELTFKIIVLFSFIFGLIGLKKWLYSLNINDKKSHFFALVSFSLSPFLINLTHFRGNIGEIMALCILPWVFYQTEELSKKINSDTIFKTIFIFSLLLISHNITVLFTVPLSILYFLIRNKTNISKLFWFAFSWFYSILLSLWFWLPALLEKKEIVLDNSNFFEEHINHFPTLKQLLFSPLEFGFSKIGSIDNFSFAVGISHVFVFIFLTILFIKNKKKLQFSPTFSFLSIMVFLLFIFQLSFTSIGWRYIPLVKYIQFPWRLSMFLIILITPLGALTYKTIPIKAKKFLWIILFIQFLNFIRISPADYFHKNNIDYDAFSQSTSTQNENLPKTFKYSEFSDWQPTANIISGQGTINIDFWNGSKRKYTLDIKEESIITEPTMNFIGWETYIIDRNNKKQIIEYIDSQDIKGRIAYKLGQGQYNIESKFTQKTLPRILGNTISIISFLFITAYWFLNFLKLKNNT